MSFEKNYLSLHFTDGDSANSVPSSMLKVFTDLSSFEVFYYLLTVCLSHEHSYLEVIFCSPKCQ